MKKPTHRHKKRGSEYEFIGIGKMQADSWFDYDSGASADMREVAIYRDINDGSLWARPREDFEDGRFEVLVDAGESLQPFTSPGVDAIAAERRRQVEAEGWTPENDEQYRFGQLAAAASCYAMSSKHHSSKSGGFIVPSRWPWAADWFKPKNRIRDLERAGALIAAEIDRLKRAEE